MLSSTVLRSSAPHPFPRRFFSDDHRRPGGSLRGIVVKKNLWLVQERIQTALVTPQMTQSRAWTNWPLFTVGLVQRGYTDEQIQKIIGGNMLRVFRASLA